MALFQVQCKSEMLGKQVRVNVVIPDGIRSAGPGATCPVVYLLHGLSDDESMWGRRTSVERYADDHQIAVVMPNGDRSWYLDIPAGKYESYIGDELPRLMRLYFPYLSDKRGQTMIAGLSMGGFGALHTALKRPEQYGAVACFSGAFRLSDFSRTFRLVSEGVLTGDPTGTDADVYMLAEQAKDQKDKFPVYLWCGTEDGLFQSTVDMRDTLKESGFAVTYSETSGTHAWQYWDREIKNAFDWWKPIREAAK